MIRFSKVCGGVLCVCFLASSGGVAVEQSSQLLSLSGSIPISGAPGGRSGVMTIDDVRHHLFINGQGNSSFIDVVDLTNETSVNRICCLKQDPFHPAGLALATRTNTLFVNNGSRPPIRITNPEVFHGTLDVALSSEAGQIAVDDVADRVYVGYGGASAGGVAAFTLSGEPVFNRRLGNYASGPARELAGPRLFVSLDGQVAAIDRATGAVIQQAPGPSDAARLALTMDGTRGRLLVGGRDGRLIVLEAGTGHLLADVGLDSGCDSIFVDAARKRVYAVGQGMPTGAGGSGRRTYAPDRYPAISILDDGVDGRLRVIGKVRIGDYVESAAWSPSLGRLYVGIPGWSWQQNEVRIYSANEPRE